MKVCDSPLHRDARAEGVVIFGAVLTVQSVLRAAGAVCIVLQAKVSGKGLTTTSVMALELQNIERTRCSFPSVPWKNKCCKGQFIYF